MPRIVDYTEVLKRMEGEEFVCNYYNGGAFGFRRGVPTEVVAFVGPADPTIRPEARPFVREVPAPYEANLARLAGRCWREVVGGGPAWVMPMSHWAFEIDFGSKGWMPTLLKEVGVEPGLLAGLNNAAAIEFGDAEMTGFERMLTGLLAGLEGSDFMVAFVGRGVLCTVHHHKQLWWVTGDRGVRERLQQMQVI